MSPAERAFARALLRSTMRGRGPDLRRLAAWSALEALPSFLAGLLIATAVDDGFLAGDTGTGFAWLGLLAASVVVGAWATRQTWLCLAAIVEPMRDQLVRAVAVGTLRRATAPGTATGTGGGVAQLTQQVEIAREAYASVLLVVQGFLVASLGALLGLLALAPAVLLLVVVPLIVGLVLFARALPGMAAVQRRSLLAEERIAEQTGAVATGMRDVVACGGEDAAAALIGEHIEAEAQASRALARYTAVRTVSVAIGGLLPVVLILAAGPWLLDHGATTGTILGALTYVLGGVQPALRSLVSGIGGPGLWLGVTLARLAEVTEEPPAEAAARTVRGPGWARPAHHGLRLGGVTFAYGPFAEPVVSGLDLTVPDSDHLAIVGPSGVGKSTLANLMAGILHPQSGEVRVGGVPIDGLDPAELAALRVLIPQEAYVIDATLRENLAYLRVDAGDAQLDAAVDALGMRQLVDRLGGYDAELDHGTLSAGERQALTLVRAYLSPAPLAILDEASCHMDPVAEAVIERAFATRPGSVVVIAHRMSSALRARRILVLDGGRPELGTHAELLERSAVYRDLVGHWEAGGAGTATA